MYPDYNFVCDRRKLKAEPYRVRLTVGGDKLSNPYNAESLTIDLLESKLLINSTIFDTRKGAQFCSVDIRYMYF